MNTVDFDPGAGTDNHTAAGNADVFISKFDSAGNFLWAITFGGTSWDYGYGIAVDTSGNIYATGQYQGVNVDFDPGAGTANLTATGIDIFMAKYDTNGNYLWVMGMGGTSNDRGRSVAVDSSGNANFAGEFMGTNIDLNTNAGGPADIHSSAGSQDIFITKLDTNAGFQWTRTMGGTGSDVAYGTALNSAGTQVYVTGQFNDVVDLDPTAGTDNHTSAGLRDIFIVNLDSNGNYTWGRSMGSTGQDIGNGITIDTSGNVLTTGYFTGTVDFDPNAGVQNLTSAGETDQFVSKLSSAGNYVWAQWFGGTSGDIGYGIAADSSDNVFAIGYFAVALIKETFSLTSNGGNDILLTKILSTGDVVSVDGMGGTGNDDGRALKIWGETVFMAGVFRDTADFDPNPEVSNLTSAGANDFFIAAYSDLPPYDEAVTPIPTVNEWGMIIFSLLLVGVSLCFMRKGKRTL